MKTMKIMGTCVYGMTRDAHCKDSLNYAILGPQ